MKYFPHGCSALFKFRTTTPMSTWTEFWRGFTLAAAIFFSHLRFKDSQPALGLQNTVSFKKLLKLKLPNTTGEPFQARLGRRCVHRAEVELGGVFIWAEVGVYSVKRYGDRNPEPRVEPRVGRANAAEPREDLAPAGETGAERA